MSVDQLITAYIEIKVEKPDDSMTPRHPKFFEAIKPPPSRVETVKHSLKKNGFILVNTDKANIRPPRHNEIVVQGSIERFREVFGANILENDNAYA